MIQPSSGAPALGDEMFHQIVKTCAHLVCQAEVEVLEQSGHGSCQADLRQGLPHAAARALRKGEVALWPLAVACGCNICDQHHDANGKLPVKTALMQHDELDRTVSDCCCCVQLHSEDELAMSSGNDSSRQKNLCGTGLGEGEGDSLESSNS